MALYQKTQPKRCAELVEHAISNPSIKRKLIQELNIDVEVPVGSAAEVAARNTANSMKKLKEMFDKASSPNDFRKVHQRSTSHAGMADLEISQGRKMFLTGMIPSKTSKTTGKSRNTSIGSLANFGHGTMP